MNRNRNRWCLIAVLLAGTVLTGCDKLAKLGLGKFGKTASTPATNSAPGTPTIIIASTSVNTNLLSLDLGTIILTNHHETILSLGMGTNCRVSPLLLSKNSVQLTLTVETKNPQGKVMDLSITQVTTPPDQKFEANVGEFTFSFIPQVVPE